MGYKSYTPQDLANFTGRPAASFPAGFITASALPQALLLFKMATCLASPDDLSSDEKQMVDFAILEFADAIHLTAPYQTARYTPFNSESIGSYSYSKAAAAISVGKVTGVGWFDLAVERLSVCDQLDGISMSMGIDVFGGGYNMPQQGEGTVRYFTDAELAQSQSFGYDPSRGRVGAPVVISEEPEDMQFEEDPTRPGIWFPKES